MGILWGGNTGVGYKPGGSCPSAGLLSSLLALRIPFFVVREVVITLACSGIAIIHASFTCGSLGCCASGRRSPGSCGNYADGAVWGMTRTVECYGFC